MFLLVALMANTRTSMGRNAYSFKRINLTTYGFTSYGKETIKKAVIFTPLSLENTFIRWFGDVDQKGHVDNEVKSDNGDALKVMATIMDIVKDFSHTQPDTLISFTGSSPTLTISYHRIIKKYYSDYKMEYTITGIIQSEDRYEEISFERYQDADFVAFNIQRTS
jgi:hypothetical protein